MTIGKQTSASAEAAWISIKEISMLCHIGQGTVRRLTLANIIPHSRIGRKILIPRQAFMHWWESEAHKLRIPPYHS